MEFIKKYPKTFQWLFLLIVFFALCFAIKVPFTIKIRSGWDEKNLNAVEVAKMAEDIGIDAITVHPRTRAQRFTGKSNWDVISEACKIKDSKERESAIIHIGKIMKSFFEIGRAHV